MRDCLPNSVTWSLIPLYFSHGLIFGNMWCFLFTYCQFHTCMSILWTCSSVPSFISSQSYTHPPSQLFPPYLHARFLCVCRTSSGSRNCCVFVKHDMWTCQIQKKEFHRTTCPHPAVYAISPCLLWMLSPSGQGWHKFNSRAFVLELSRTLISQQCNLVC